MNWENVSHILATISSYVDWIWNIHQTSFSDYEVVHGNRISQDHNAFTIKDVKLQKFLLLANLTSTFCGCDSHIVVYS